MKFTSRGTPVMSKPESVALHQYLLSRLCHTCGAQKNKDCANSKDGSVHMGRLPNGFDSAVWLRQYRYARRLSSASDEPVVRNAFIIKVRWLHSSDIYYVYDVNEDRAKQAVALHCGADLRDLQAFLHVLECLKVTTIGPVKPITQLN
jgi:hypothetical protein